MPMKREGGAAVTIAKSTIEGCSLATEMTKRELIAMHILAAYCSAQIEEDERSSFMENAEYAVLQTEALLIALHDDPEEDDAT